MTLPPRSADVEEMLMKIDEVIEVPTEEVEIRPLDTWSRFSDGFDAFMFWNAAEHGGECNQCLLGKDKYERYVGDNLNNFIGHVTRHRKAGHNLPGRLEDLVRASWPKGSA